MTFATHSGYAFYWNSLGTGITTNLYISGYNIYGQIGTNSSSTAEPFRPNDKSWSKIALGRYHTLGIRSDNLLFGWGYNNYGQVGDGTVNHRSSPTQIGTSNWSMITVGKTSMYGIKDDGSLWSWGYNAVGQLGIGDKINLVQYK